MGVREWRRCRCGESPKRLNPPTHPPTHLEHEVLLGAHRHAHPLVVQHRLVLGRAVRAAQRRVRVRQRAVRRAAAAALREVDLADRQLRPELVRELRGRVEGEDDLELVVEVGALAEHVADHGEQLAVEWWWR